ncbi:hypothetical protein [Amycolatopsis camponoti]|uniref:hypothetical protein n=1 Tax=Amycolatopsis camponoti TaxID=2606593 RepID=UPI0012D7CF1C|nr:hypothetical protein [Amycolatopsis camponoti]
MTAQIERSTVNEPSADAALRAESGQTPDEVELFLQLGSVRDFAVGCRELIQVADEIAARSDTRSPREVADDAARQAGTPSDVRSRVEEIFAEADLEASAHVAAAFDGEGVAVDEMTADPFAMIARRLQPDAIVEQIATRLRTEFAGQPGAELYVAAYVAATLRRPRKPLLLRALLAAICGQVEVCVLRIMRRELMSQGSYSGISDPQLETDVRKLMGGGLQTWRSNLNSLLGVDVTAGSADWPGVVELFERRHLLVHREGLVDHRYRTRVSDAPPAGSSLEPTSVYMHQVIDLCETVTVGLIGQLLARRRPELTDQLVGIAAAWAEEAVAEGAWLRAEGYHLLAGVLTADQVEGERRRVDSWLDRQERLGVDAIRDEVAAWDTEPLPPEFELARLVLLGENEAGLRLLAQLRAEGLVGDQDVDAWRLFSRWRKQGVVP